MIQIYLKRFFGIIAFLFGFSLCGWFVYNQIWPTEEFKSGFRSVFQLFLPIACLAVGWKWMRYKGKGIDEAIPPELKCPELDASIVKAKETLPEFISEVEKGIDGAFVKFSMITSQGLTEKFGHTCIFTRMVALMFLWRTSLSTNRNKAKVGATFRFRMLKIGKSYHRTVLYVVHIA